MAGLMLCSMLVPINKTLHEENEKQILINKKFCAQPSTIE